ncbi:MAG: selenoneine biosynthesis selenosugar synthase SenB [Burkholderiales bacterium]
MPRRRLPVLLLVTPYLAQANNGNWRTAARWARLLGASYRVILQASDATATDGPRADAVAMIALHARRSAGAIAAWRAHLPTRPLVVALTGTDLYHDIPAGDAAAHASLAAADALVMLQEDAPAHVPPGYRDKACVVFQSARALAPWPRKSATRLDCLLVAHLRAEKDPATAFAAFRRLAADVPATLTIIGAALDPALGDAAHALAASDPRVQWLGPRPHAWTRQAIKRAHVLLVPSRMEGGANVVVEAITAGTPVLGSRMSGNVGMLGADYAGCFAVGDADGLAALVARAAADRTFLAALGAQCARRAPLFTPAAEQAALHAALARAIAAHRHRMPA